MDLSLKQWGLRSKGRGEERMGMKRGERRKGDEHNELWKHLKADKGRVLQGFFLVT